MLHGFLKSDDPFESEGERKLYDALKLLGVDVVPQYPVGRLRLDMMVRGDYMPIDVEVDGYTTHKNRWRADFKRNFVLKNLGYEVIRFQHSRAVKTPQRCAEDVEEMIRTQERGDPRLIRYKRLKPLYSDEYMWAGKRKRKREIKTYTPAAYLKMIDEMKRKEISELKELADEVGI